MILQLLGVDLMEFSLKKLPRLVRRALVHDWVILESRRLA